MRIIFFGTPTFAKTSLQKLHESDHDVVAVVTSTDKLGGRGRKQLLQSDVKKYADQQGILTLQPKNLKSKSFVHVLKELNADLFVVVAFRMLPKVVWNMPPKGTINLHGSLLPAYRGAAPINWAIINGEKETGVTTFYIQEKIDTGALLLQKTMPIPADDNVGDIHDKMMVMGSDVLLETVNRISENNIESQPQDDSKASHAPKLHKDNTRINWEESAHQVHNFIRGLSPYPGAWTTLPTGEQLKIYRASYSEDSALEAGAFLLDESDVWEIGCKSGCIIPLEIQLAGKKRMDVKSFLNGYRQLIDPSK